MPGEDPLNMPLSRSKQARTNGSTSRGRAKPEGNPLLLALSVPARSADLQVYPGSIRADTSSRHNICTDHAKNPMARARLLALRLRSASVQIHPGTVPPVAANKRLLPH